MSPSTPAKRSKNIRRDLDDIIWSLSKRRIIKTETLCALTSSRRRNVQKNTIARLMAERDDVMFIEDGMWMKIEPRLSKRTNKPRRIERA